MRYFALVPFRRHDIPQHYEEILAKDTLLEVILWAYQYIQKPL